MKTDQVVVVPSTDAAIVTDRVIDLSKPRERSDVYPPRHKK